MKSGDPQGNGKQKTLPEEKRDRYGILVNKYRRILMRLIEEGAEDSAEAEYLRRWIQIVSKEIDDYDEEEGET